jgi:hypothetical protein
VAPSRRQPGRGLRPDHHDDPDPAGPGHQEQRGCRNMNSPQTEFSV